MTRQPPLCAESKQAALAHALADYHAENCTDCRAITGNVITVEVGGWGHHESYSFEDAEAEEAAGESKA